MAILAESVLRSDTQTGEVAWSYGPVGIGCYPQCPRPFGTSTLSRQRRKLPPLGP